MLFLFYVIRFLLFLSVTRHFSSLICPWDPSEPCPDMTHDRVPRKSRVMENFALMFPSVKDPGYRKSESFSGKHFLSSFVRGWIKCAMPGCCWRDPLFLPLDTALRKDRWSPKTQQPFQACGFPAIQPFDRSRRLLKPCFPRLYNQDDNICSSDPDGLVVNSTVRNVRKTKMRCMNVPWNWYYITISCIRSVVVFDCLQQRREWTVLWKSEFYVSWNTHRGSLFFDLLALPPVGFCSHLRGPRGFHHFVYIPATRGNEARGRKEGASFLFKSHISLPHPPFTGQNGTGGWCPSPPRCVGGWELESSLEQAPPQLRIIRMVTKEERVRRYWGTFPNLCHVNWEEEEYEWTWKDTLQTARHII